MRCPDAREAIQNHIDGVEDAQADVALAHLNECAECREWKAGIDALHAAFVEARGDVPEIDVASAVMSSLPPRHPAAVRSGARAWTRRRALAWVAACWVAGLVALVTAGALLVGSGWIAPAAVSHMPGAVSAVLAPVASGAAKADVLSETMLRAATVLGADLMATAARHYVSIALFLAFDSVLLIVALVLWLKRKALRQRFLVLT